MKKAIVLLSGGLDSATCLALAKKEGYQIYALSFKYGQRHAVELEAADEVAQAVGVEAHKVIEIDLRAFGGSALTSDIDVPKGRNAEEMGAKIPITYVPARNTIFLSYALAWAEVLEAQTIFIGVNAVDYSGYPDCRPKFIAAYQAMANLATAANVDGSRPIEIKTPLIALSKKAIIELGLTLGVNYGLTTSCYDPLPNGNSCGECDTCALRLKGFNELGMSDPRPYGK